MNNSFALYLIKSLASCAKTDCYRRRSCYLVQQMMALSSLQSRGGVNIQISQTSKLIDSKLEIQILGLHQQQKYTIAMAILEQEGKAAFVSHAHFKSCEKGTISLATDASIGGSYTGIDPMGMFWSMVPALEHQKGIRLIKKNVEEPFTFQLAVLPNFTVVESVQQIKNPEVLASTVIERWYHDADNIHKIPVRHGKLRGTLFIPKSGGPFPGVLDMFGTGGGLLDFRAALLASKGFVTFALPYFAYDDLPKDVDLDMEYFDDAVDFLQSQPSVCPGGVGVTGNSKGSDIVLHLAINNPKIRAAVPINGPYIVQYGTMRVKGQEIYSILPDINKFEFSDDGIMTMINGYYPNMDADERAVLPIEKTPDTCQYLFIQGEDDKAIGCHHYPYLCQKLKDAGKSNYKLLSYPGAGHLIEPPYTPVNAHVYHGLFGVIMDYGGIPQLHGKAQEHYWQSIQTFFKKYVGKAEYTQQSLNSKL